MKIPYYYDSLGCIDLVKITARKENKLQIKIIILFLLNENSFRGQKCKHRIRREKLEYFKLCFQCHLKKNWSSYTHKVS